MNSLVNLDNLCIFRFSQMKNYEKCSYLGVVSVVLDLGFLQLLDIAHPTNHFFFLSFLFYLLIQN